MFSRDSSRLVLSTFVFWGALGCQPAARTNAAGPVASPIMPAASASAATLASDAPAPASVHLELRVPPEVGSSGTLLLVPLTEAELAQGRLGEPTFFGELLQRLRVRRDVVARDGVITLDVELPPERRSLFVIYDAAGLGLEALFGPRAGLATGSVSLSPGASSASLALVGKAFREPTEDCTGEREEKLVIDAPETRGEHDPGTRFVCVRLPSSYARSPKRRYPVVLVFPGYSGLATRGNVWQQRALFDSIGAEVGEAIFVGVATRVAEGSSYLQRSRRFGDWDTFLSQHLVKELASKYRTNDRRGTIGHSTGGWMSIALATRHPEAFMAAAASSPDALDLGTWLLDGRGNVRPDWLAWMRAEAAMGRAGQFVSYGAAWSEVTGPGSSGRGFAWPVDLESGAIAQDVLARWLAASPAAELVADPARTKRLSGKLLITAGKADEFGLFPPTARYVELLRQRGIEATWIPTDLGHFGKDDLRFAPLVRGLLERLR